MQNRPNKIITAYTKHIEYMAACVLQVTQITSTGLCNGFSGHIPNSTKPMHKPEMTKITEVSLTYKGAFM